MHQCLPDILVVWAHARSPARLDESLQKLADDVEIPAAQSVDQLVPTRL